MTSQLHVNKRQSRRTARQTLLLDPDEAAYWLAATSFVDQDDIPSLPTSPMQISNKSPFQSHRSPPPPSATTKAVKTLHEIRRPSRELAPLKPSRSPSVDHNLLPALAIDEVPKAKQHIECVEETQDVLPPNAAFRAYDSSLIDSPCIATRPGSSLTYMSPQIGSTEKRASMQSVRPSYDSRLSCLGASIISAFPAPPPPQHVRLAGTSSAHRLHAVESVSNPGTAKVPPIAVARPTSKPLPALPSIIDDDYVDDRDSGDEESRLSDEMSSLPQHRPMCPYANHRERLSDQCDCLSFVPRPYGGHILSQTACSSAPNLLDIQPPSSNEDRKQKELTVAKKILNRLSDEIRCLQVGQPRSATRAIRWQDQEDSCDRKDKSRTYEMLASSDSGPIKSIKAWTATVASSSPVTSSPITVPDNTHRSSRSLDVTDQSREPNLPLRRALYGQRSYDCLADSYETAVTSRLTDTPPQSARRLISTVRSHDRHQTTRGSPVLNPSSPATQKQLQGNVGKHHRHTSSKSSTASSATSSLGTQRSTSSNGMTTDTSSPNTPPRHVGRSPLKLWQLRNAQAANTRTISPKRQKQDAEYFQSAIDPFPVNGLGSRSHVFQSPNTSTTLPIAQQPGWHYDHPNGLQSRTYFGASPKLAGSSKGAEQTFLGSAL